MNAALREYVEVRAHQLPVINCWLWMLSCGSHGYGQGCMPDRRVTVAHRISYLAFKGEIPDGMLVQHSCDNKWCVNPDHLSLGTDKTNSDDKHAKGRANLERRRNLTRRLNEHEIALIRSSTETSVALAKLLGVDIKTVQKVRAGITYKETHPANENS